MAKQTTNDAAVVAVADICLYGGGAAGAGYIATLGSRMFGSGSLNVHNSLTDAMWTGLIELQSAGVDRGLVRVFEPSGLRMAYLDARRPVSFGELAWVPAPVFVISVEELLKHAEPAS